MLRQCEFYPVDQSICYQAHLNMDEPDYDDAIVAECAKAAGADFILSSDAAAFQKSVVRKMSPEECVEFLSGTQQNGVSTSIK